MHIDYADATPVAAGVGKYFWLTDARLRESYTGARSHPKRDAR